MKLPRPARRRPSILLTSLVDVLFVLLFFFMLVSGGVGWNTVGLDLSGRLPETVQGPLQSIELRRDGRQLLNGEALSEAEIRRRLAEPGTRAVLVAEPGVSLQALLDVFDRYRRDGALLTLGRSTAGG
ncbi:MAG TPA: biopolymer transporter ExbD [Nevskiaceae bacterium]|nr:biopolymer transporter ExbD [Nevskiaceae bacterium]